LHRLKHAFFLCSYEIYTTPKNIILGFCILLRVWDQVIPPSPDPSTQRHYRRLIYYLLYCYYCYIFRSYDHHQPKNILIARVTQLTTDPLFYSIANIIVIITYIQHSWIYKTITIMYVLYY
jgi:phenylpyruvate tautomerase PptA (4-oxalocrotonate tautomerase family)